MQPGQLRIAEAQVNRPEHSGQVQVVVWIDGKTEQVQQVPDLRSFKETTAVCNRIGNSPFLQRFGNGGNMGHIL